mgnify:CR=1 FL=1
MSKRDKAILKAMRNFRIETVGADTYIVDATTGFAIHHDGDMDSAIARVVRIAALIA